VRVPDWTRFVRDLFVADAWSTAGGNSGSRIAFGLDGTIYMTVGERHEQTPAQDLRTHKGKILRLNDDGTIPPDNPFVGRKNACPEIFAYGVRNPQGLFVDPSTGTIWEHEHGPRGGDELNIIARGHNYGWPAITYGINYNGTTISKETAHDGMDQPVVHWTPSISPSGLTIYSGDRFADMANTRLDDATRSQLVVRRCAVLLCHYDTKGSSEGRPAGR
jgi:glucose/arabinose dehydrogenase